MNIATPLTNYVYKRVYKRVYKWESVDFTSSAISFHASILFIRSVYSGAVWSHRNLRERYALMRFNIESCFHCAMTCVDPLRATSNYWRCYGRCPQTCASDCRRVYSIFAPDSARWRCGYCNVSPLGSKLRIICRFSSSTIDECYNLC